jgi:sugar lactone lactonase YvrE
MYHEPLLNSSFRESMASFLPEKVDSVKLRVFVIFFALSSVGCFFQKGVFSQTISLQRIHSLRNQFSKTSYLFEDFDSRDIDRRLKNVHLENIHDSFLEIKSDGEHLWVHDRIGFTRAVVCYKLTSSEGHLFIGTVLSEGYFAMYNDVLGCWAWEDSKQGQTRFTCKNFGQPSASTTNNWILHEMRIEDGKLKYFNNEQLLGSVPLSPSKKMRTFEISASRGRGVVDFVALFRGQGRKSSSLPTHNVEVLIPPSPTVSAPFDSTVLPDGTILMAGSENFLVSVSLDGKIEKTEYPSGMYFECDEKGVMWYYNFPEGSFYLWDPKMKKKVKLGDLPPAHSDGSIAVSKDGKAVYIGWWLHSKNVSALYMYTASSGLIKLLERPPSSMISAVEVAPDGSVFVACADGIYQLRENNRLEPFYIFEDKNINISSDSLVADNQNNLYFCGFGDCSGIFQLARKEKQLNTIVRLQDPIEIPFGLSWHEKLHLIIGVRKGKGQIVSIDLTGKIRVLNHPSGLTTPISIEEHPDGSIFVNGDEVGLLKIDRDRKVQIFCTRICSYQPPPADFVFDRNGLIYYTSASPGFPSAIISIDKNKRIKEITGNVGSPAGIDIAPDDQIYYADFKEGMVCLLSRDGKSVPVIKDLNYPLGLSIDDQGNFWVGTAEAGQEPGSLGEMPSRKILKFSREGRLLETIDFTEFSPGEITFFDVDKHGKLYVPFRDILIVRDSDGDFEAVEGEFKQLRGAKVFTDGYLYFVDTPNSALYRIKTE